MCSQQFIVLHCNSERLPLTQIKLHMEIHKIRARQLLKSNVPQGSLLAPALSSIFLSNTGSGIECTLSKFTDDTELCGAVDALEGRDVIQRDLGKLERWDCANIVEFNKAKSKILQGSGQSEA